MEEQSLVKIPVVWRGNKLNVEVDPKWNVKEFGEKLQGLTNVKPETMRLLVPQPAKKSSKMITPYSDVYSSLSLQEAAIFEGKPIRMMGVFDTEIEEVSENSKKANLRIAGFDEEEKRLKHRMSARPRTSFKLPQGEYIFCDFRTLHIPGIELNPPPSEALRRMHMLASDPGIIAIMNKHRWRVGIMTEMAPVGYVGISPKCLLGFNKNQGEEISLRLRTDDLKGFRKYESIKKTLLHELAHMVYSEHDADFFALDKQLNEEAAALDWTKSRSHTLSGHKTFDSYDEELSFEVGNNIGGQKLGGSSNSSASVRALSAEAAHQRLMKSSTNGSEVQVHPETNGDQATDAAAEPDPDEVGQEFALASEPDPDDSLVFENDAMHVDIVAMNVDIVEDIQKPSESFILEECNEPDPDDCREPNPDDSDVQDAMAICVEPDPDDSLIGKETRTSKDPTYTGTNNVNTDFENKVEPDPDGSVCMKSMKSEPDPDDRVDGTNNVNTDFENKFEPDPDDSVCMKSLKSEPDPDDRVDGLDSVELRVIEEPVVAICSRLQEAIKMLRLEVSPLEATSVFQTLFKIIRNVIEHPNEVKFRRLRKANPQFQRNVANYRAAIEILNMVGFSEDVILDEVGRAETYLVLKRNDPGLLWLAKSSLEITTA
ncbi:uncharacterized protein LOC109706396 [Ananas comosus]|uniref:Uncharacterized protein LOC109706396 n=1 Tax=Ananas comosus TaxID=4615 RepID=A0A6P5ENB7_ANACO|nr:uncharacterized protein LOC109706396 [Ananas comosus]XP_020082791.1 uncharacterized protein LOC109706396 [Ananas comosus]XP_020082792.1 uncharacterized protein LOC109706396 [Ananas comosus]